MPYIQNIKHLLVIFILLIALPSSAQQYLNGDYDANASLPGGNIDDFKWNGTEVIWQHVYEYEASIEDFKLHFKNLKIFEEFEIRENTIIATLKRSKINFKKYNLGPFDYAPLYGYPYSCHVQIDIKENKYRVLLSSFIFYPDTQIGISIYGVSASTNQNTTYDLSVAYNLRKNTFKRSFQNTEGLILNDILQTDFDYNNLHNSIQTDNDW